MSFSLLLFVGCTKVYILLIFSFFHKLVPLIALKGKSISRIHTINWKRKDSDMENIIIWWCWYVMELLQNQYCTHAFDSIYPVICEITPSGLVWNFLNGSGCLNMAFLICRSTLFLVPPWFTIRSNNDFARGTKSFKSKVQRAILRNSDMMEP